MLYINEVSGVMSSTSWLVTGTRLACPDARQGGTPMTTAKERRQKQLAVVGAIGHEHFMTGVRMLYACRYNDALNHFLEASMLEPDARGYLSYLGLATAHAKRKFSDAEHLCR